MHYFMRSKKWRLWAILGALLAAAPALAGHDYRGERVFYIKGVGVTGINDLCGKSIWTFDYPPPLPPDFRTPNFGILDPRPGATDAIPLSAQNCSNPNNVLATTIDPVFAEYIGVPPDQIDKRLLNLPLRDVPMPVFFDGLRGTVPTLESVPPPAAVVQTLSKPSYPITVGEWFKARGDMVIRCKADGTASAVIKFRHLIPGGAYTVWGSWRTLPPGAPGEAVIPVPFGGAPNSIIPNAKGSATFVRTFAYCPMDPPGDGSKLLFVALVYHPDGVLYGAAPGPFLERLRFKAKDGSIYTSYAIPGILIQDQLIFSITGKEIR